MPHVTAEQITYAVRKGAKSKRKSSSTSGGEELTGFLTLLESHDVEVKGKPKRKQTTDFDGWWIDVEKCVFDPNHPASFFLRADGSGAGYKCWRCQDKHWNDVEKLWDIKWPEPFRVAVTEDLLHQTWFHDLDLFLNEPVPDMTVYLEQDGVPILFDRSAHEIYSFRGVGKSYFSNQLVSVLVHGGEWLHFKSRGGFKVAIVDVELSRRQLVDRLKSTVGASNGLVRIMTPEKLEGRFPNLSSRIYQQKVVEEIEAFGAEILIIDSLTAGFKINTNDPGQLAAVNDFIRELKMKHGLCVVILHHAGKNETQRGRTDIEDHLELVIKLSPMPETYVGELRVQLEYEKKREKGIIHNFCFAVDANGEWQVLEDSRTLEIINLLLRGVSWSAIERKLRVSSKTIAKIKRTAEERGTKFPAADSQRQKR